MVVKPLHEKYGQTKRAWDAFKAEAREHMVAAASKRAMITYGDLASRMTTVAVEPHDPMLWAIIGDVASDEATAGRGLLSVVVSTSTATWSPARASSNWRNTSAARPPTKRSASSKNSTASTPSGA